MDKNIRTQISFRKEKIRKKWVGKVHTYKKVAHKFLLFVKGRNFNAEFPNYLRKFNKIGLSFEIEPIHKSIYINGYFYYLSEKDFDKVMRDLEKIIRVHNVTNRGR